MIDEPVPPAFPCGLIVHLRSIYPVDGTLHRVPFPSGREIIQDDDSTLWCRVFDETEAIIGIFHIDAIAFILPLPPEVMKAPDADN